MIIHSSITLPTLLRSRIPIRDEYRNKTSVA